MDRDVRSAEASGAPPLWARFDVRTLLLAAAWVSTVVVAETLLPPQWMLAGMAPLIWIGLWGFYSILRIPAAGSALVSGLLATVLANLPSFLLLLVTHKTKRDLSLIYYAIGWSMAFSVVAAIVYPLALGVQRALKRIWQALRRRKPPAHPSGESREVPLGVGAISAALVIVHFVWTTALFFAFQDRHETFTHWIRWTDWPGRTVFQLIELQVQLAPVPQKAADSRQASAPKPADTKKPDNAKPATAPKKPADSKQATASKKPADAKAPTEPTPPTIVPLWLASQAFGVLFYVILGWLIGKDLEQANPRRKDDEEDEAADS